MDEHAAGVSKSPSFSHSGPRARLVPHPRLGFRIVGKEQPAMSALAPIPFTCPGCWRNYEIVMIDPSPFDAREATVKCVFCGVAFPTTEGSALLQYFPRDPTGGKPADLPR